MLPDVSPGTRPIRLSELAPNCQVDGPNPRDVSVTAGTDARDTALVEFNGLCEILGSRVPAAGGLALPRRTGGTSNWSAAVEAFLVA